MTRGRIDWTNVVILMAVAMTLICGTVDAEAATNLEARFVLDSSSCPVAVDLWLHSLEDTLAGLEVVLQWDRPNVARFRIDSSQSPDSVRAMDTLRAPVTRGLDRTTPKLIPVIELDGTILESWAYLEGRTKDGLRIKITGLMNLVGLGEATPLYPCDSIRLLRLPVDFSMDANSPPADSIVSVLLVPSQTRLSTNWGNLVTGLKLIGATSHSAGCVGSTLSK